MAIYTHRTPAGGRSHERASQTCALFPACPHSYFPNPSGGSRRPSTGGRWRAAAQHWRRGLAAAARSGQHPAAKQAADQRRAVAAGGLQPGSGPSNARRHARGVGCLPGRSAAGLGSSFFSLNDSEKKKGEQVDDEQCAILIRNYLLICDNCRAM